MRLPKGKLVGRGEVASGINYFRKGGKSGYLLMGEGEDECAILFLTGKPELSFCRRGGEVRYGDAVAQTLNPERQCLWFEVPNQKIELLRKYYREMRITKPELFFRRVEHQLGLRSSPQPTPNQVVAESITSTTDTNRSLLLKKLKIDIDEEELDSLVESFQMENLEDEIQKSLRRSFPFRIDDYSLKLLKRDDKTYICTGYITLTAGDVNVARTWLGRYLGRMGKKRNIEIINRVFISTTGIR